MECESGSTRDTILVVDDDRIIVEILSQSLVMAEYDVLTAFDGEEGLALARARKPDLVLLDVMMPKMDGYSVCSELKQDPETQFIPIIILTALTDRDDKLRALEAGADEFIRKPPDRQELLIRIKSLLRTRRLFAQVRASNEELRQLEQVRQDLAHMIAHDMRAPLSSIISILELILGEDAADPGQVHGRLLRDALFSGRRIMTMLEAMLDVQRIESGQMPVNLKPVVVGDVIREAVQGIQPLLQEGKLHIDVGASQPSSPVMLDPVILGRLVNNLLFNAVRFSPNGGRVGIWTQATARWVIINVADQGPGIPQGDRERVFEKFVQLGEGERTGLGLGLAFCRLAANAMDGAIWVEDAPNAGALFRCAFPLGLPGSDSA